MAAAMDALPSQVEQILERASEVAKIAEDFHGATNFLYLGRGYNFPAALEGALKLKEISYIHAEDRISDLAGAAGLGRARRRSGAARGADAVLA
jgi:glucosamine 6-phosphate synthetase-like amidotransferase/phosphosugar isomerase protein